MEVEIISQKDNPLLNRLEVDFKVLHPKETTPKRKEIEMFETLNELVKVRKKALSLAKNWNIINTAQSVENTFAHIEEILDKIDCDTLFI